MKIGVVGGGSIGLLISSYFCLEHKVTVYVRRNSQKEKLNKYGLHITNTLSALPVKSLLLEEMEEEDCLIICVKQPQLPKIIPTLRQLVNKRIPLLFLQNGMGHIKRLQSLSNPLFIGVVEHGALRENDHTVTHTGKGMIKVAAYHNEDEILDFLIQKLHRQHFPVKKSLNWEQLLLHKLAVNAVINPLTALFNITNGKIVTNQYICSIAKRICHEVSIALDLDSKRQWERVEKIAINTGKNTSSMLTDMKKGQKTEIEALLGYIMDVSKADHPFLTFAYKGVKALEMEKKVRQNG